MRQNFDELDPLGIGTPTAPDPTQGTTPQGVGVDTGVPDDVLGLNDLFAKVAQRQDFETAHPRQLSREERLRKRKVELESFIQNARRYSGDPIEPAQKELAVIYDQLQQINASKQGPVAILPKLGYPPQQDTMEVEVPGFGPGIGFMSGTPTKIRVPVPPSTKSKKKELPSILTPELLEKSQRAADEAAYKWKYNPDRPITDQDIADYVKRENVTLEKRKDIRESQLAIIRQHIQTERYQEWAADPYAPGHYKEGEFQEKLGKLLRDTADIFPQLGEQATEYIGRGVGYEPGWWTEHGDPQLKKNQAGTIGLASIFLPGGAGKLAQLGMASGLAAPIVEKGFVEGGKEDLQGLYESAAFWQTTDSQGNPLTPYDRGLRFTNALMFAAGASHLSVEAWKAGNKGLGALEMSRQSNIGLGDSYRILTALDKVTKGSMDLTQLGPDGVNRGVRGALTSRVLNGDPATFEKLAQIDLRKDQQKLSIAKVPPVATIQPPTTSSEPMLTDSWYTNKPTGQNIPITFDHDPLGMTHTPPHPEDVPGILERGGAAQRKLSEAGVGDYTPAPEQSPNRGISTQTADSFESAMKDIYGLGNKQAKAVRAIAEARARSWASRTGLDAEEWFKTRIAGVERTDAPILTNGKYAKGAVSFLRDGRAVIKAFGAQDVSTAVHELGHVFRRDLDPYGLKVTEDWAGVKDGVWKVEHEEAFARAFERYLRDGQAPTPGLRHVFAQFTKWLKDIYHSLKGNDVDSSTISPEMRQVFDRLLTEKDGAGTPMASPFGLSPEDGATLSRLAAEHGGILDLEHLKGLSESAGQPSLFDGSAPLTDDDITLAQSEKLHHGTQEAYDGLPKEGSWWSADKEFADTFSRKSNRPKDKIGRTVSQDFSFKNPLDLSAFEVGDQVTTDQLASHLGIDKDELLSKLSDRERAILESNDRFGGTRLFTAIDNAGIGRVAKELGHDAIMASEKTNAAGDRARTYKVLDNERASKPIKPERAQIVADAVSGGFKAISPEEMRAHLENNDRAATLSDYSVADLSKMHSYQLGDANIAYALKHVDHHDILGGKSLDVIGVVNNDRVGHARGIATPAVLLHAIDEWTRMGGRDKVGPLTLDAWDVGGRLPRKYAEFGFKEIGRSKYDADAYGPPPQELVDAWKKDGWKEGRPYPDVVYMEFNDGKIDGGRSRDLYLRQGTLYSPRAEGFHAEGIAALRDSHDAGVGRSGEGGVREAKPGGPDVQGVRTRGPRQRDVDAPRPAQTPVGNEGPKRMLDDYKRMRSMSDDELKSLGVDPNKVRELPAPELYQAEKADQPKKPMTMGDYHAHKADLVSVVDAELAKGRTSRAVFMGMKKSYNLPDYLVKQLRYDHAKVEAIRDGARMIAKDGGNYRTVTDAWAKNDYIPKADYKRLYAEAADRAGQPVATLKNKKGERVAIVAGERVTMPASMVADVDKWVSTHWTRMKTEGRNFEQIAKGNRELYDYVVEHREKAVTAMVDERSAWRDKIKANVPLLIRDKVASALTMEFGEGKITLDDLKAKRPHDWQEIVNADKWFRSQYDDLLNRVNKVRSEFGMSEIERRTDYYTHLSETATGWQKLLSNLADRRGGILSDIFGDSTTARPSRGTRNSSFNPFAQKRLGKEARMDALAAFEGYLDPTLSQIHLTDTVMRRRVLANALRAKAESFRAFNDATWEEAANRADNWAELVNDHANVLAGQRQKIDTELEKWTGSKLPSVVRWLQSTVGRSRIIGNLRSAIMQTSGLALGIPEFGLTNIAKGSMLNAMEAMGKGEKLIEKSDFLRRRYSDTSTVRPTLIQKSAKVVSIPMEVIERSVGEMIWRGAYERATGNTKLLGGLGMDEANAIKYADRMTERVLAGRAKGEQPLGFETQAGKAALQFQLEVGNFLQHLGHDFVTDHNGVRLSNGEITYKAVKLAATLYALNTLMENLIGDTPLPDPLRLLIGRPSEAWDTVAGSHEWHGDLADVAKSRKGGGEKLLRGAGRILGEFLSMVPGGSQIAGFVPEQGVAGIDRKKLFGRSEVGNFAGGAPLTGELSDLIRNPVGTLTRDVAIPIAGGQIQKTVRGIDALTNGGVSKNIGRGNFATDGLWQTFRAGTHDPHTGKQNYRVKGGWDSLRSILFGPSGTGAAQSYFEKQYDKELKKKPSNKKKPTRG